MAVTTVQSILDKAEIIIQDETNIRWDEQELLGWLNDAYKQTIGFRPDASVKQQTLTGLANGKSMQTLPTDAIRLIDIYSNTNSGTAIRYVDKRVLDDQIPNWHRSAEQEDIKHFCYDTKDPKTFFLYPTPTITSSIEVSYASVPSHSDTTGTIKIDDVYAPAILDYILYRAYLKDADYAANDNRAQLSYSSYMNGIGAGTQQPEAKG